MTEVAIIHPGRKWWPDSILDEVMPSGKEEPSKWLFRLNDGAHAFGDTDLTDGGHGFERVAEGATVGFSYSDDLGVVTLTLDADGTHRWSAPIPAETTHVWEIGDSDTLADSPDEFVQFMREAGETEGEYTVGLVHWSDSAPFRFTAEAGEPRFVRVEQKDA